MIAYFLAYSTKELVLSTAWRKKEVHLNGKRVFFDHDYPVETMKKRKEYAPLRKVLKAKGLRFQTPAPARLRVFYEEGPTTYTNAKEAAEDMLKRGILSPGEETAAPVAVGNQRSGADTAPRRRLTDAGWELREPTKRRNHTAGIDRAREKLRRFQHSQRL